MLLFLVKSLFEQASIVVQLQSLGEPIQADTSDGWVATPTSSYTQIHTTLDTHHIGVIRDLELIDWCYICNSYFHIC